LFAVVGNIIEIPIYIKNVGLGLWVILLGITRPHKKAFSLRNPDRKFQEISLKTSSLALEMRYFCSAPAWENAKYK